MAAHFLDQIRLTLKTDARQLGQIYITVLDLNTAPQSAPRGGKLNPRD